MQVLDSFGLDGASYSINPPIVNAALPPLTFQTFDCYFTPFSASNRAPTITLYLYGVLVQSKTVVDKATEAPGVPGDYLAVAELFLSAQ